jgi:hypothetical protein
MAQKLTGEFGRTSLKGSPEGELLMLAIRIRAFSPLPTESAVTVARCGASEAVSM